MERDAGWYVFGNDLRRPDGSVAATFSSHWAAVAAMIRRHDPDFVSLGGDKPEDLEREKGIR